MKLGLVGRAVPSISPPFSGCTRRPARALVLVRACRSVIVAWGCSPRHCAEGVLPWSGVRVAEGTALEMRCAGNCTEGSNPSRSVCFNDWIGRGRGPGCRVGVGRRLGIHGVRPGRSATSRTGRPGAFPFDPLQKAPADVVVRGFREDRRSTHGQRRMRLPRFDRVRSRRMIKPFQGHGCTRSNKN